MKKMILFTIFSMLFLYGCKDYVEIQNLTIATAIGVDKAPENQLGYSVSVEIVQFEQDTPQVSVISGVGQTYLEAITNATKQLGNQLYFSHAQVMIISEEVANQGIYPFVDAIYRNSDLRLDMAVLIAKNTTAISVLQAEADGKKIAGSQIKNTLDSNHVISEIPEIPAYEFINDLTSNGVCGSLSAITLDKDGKREIDGLAIFDGDIIYGFLDKKQTKTLSFLHNKTKTGRIINEYDENTPTYGLEMSKASISPRIVDGQLVFDFKIDMKIELLQEQIARNTVDSDVLERMEQEITMAVKKDFNDLILYQASNKNADFIGLGDVVHRKFPEQWSVIEDDFSSYIENIKYTLDVECEIIGTGLVSNALQLVK